MATTTFETGTVITADWLNDVDEAVYNPSSTELTAGDISNVPAGTIVATDVQAAIDELDSTISTKANLGANSDITSLSGLTTPLTVAQGGTSVATLTDEAILIGNGTSAIQTLAPSTAGNIVAVNAAGNAYALRATITRSSTSTNLSSTGTTISDIASWAQRITITINGASTNGTSFLALRVGTSSGIVATGYSGTCGAIHETDNIALNSSTTEIPLQAVTPSAGDTFTGTITLDKHGAGPVWSYSGIVISAGSNSRAMYIAGFVTLTATLDRIQLTTTGGSDTFDAGNINVGYM